MDTARWVGLAAVVVITLIAAILLGPLVPYWVDDVRLDGIVRAVALDWRDFGEEAARERLQFELDAQGIDPAVRDDSCVLEATEQGARSVVCEWTVQAKAVWGPTELSFQSIAHMDASGDLR
ncbi:MAG: hypothetical protein EP330_03210 [Deltaproteobacteria bacterium]|nr:MAG: hypothetical protein EP330_03210 [Deltaproteobacteria bacterium]